jgi:hypothetical protein
MSARADLIDLQLNGDPYSWSSKDIESLQLQAAQESFERHRERVAVLDRRARDVGIEKISSFDDVVPLLFSHTTYKSYPLSFVTGGKWQLLLKWYGTLAAVPVDDVDLSQVDSIDEFLDRLWRAGHAVYVTSGTSGKCSLLNHTHGDREFSALVAERTTGWPNVVAPEPIRRMYWLGPKKGPMRGIDVFGTFARLFAKPDEVVHLSEETVRVSDLMRAGALRKAMQDGTATPQEIADFRRGTATKAEVAAAAFERVVADIADHHTEPLVMSGMWAQQYQIAMALKATGVPSRDFHPQTLVTAGGGRKNLDMPEDFEQQVFEFFGAVRRTNSYGMTEMNAPHQACEAGRYHLLPWVLVLVLDEAGEHLRTADSGVIEGRHAFLDTSFEGRWGGLITGDRIFVDHDQCACGRPGQTILPDIKRYGELAGDDKITCAGTFDSYARGLVG